MDESKSYQVNLNIFQGPLDLLLFLIKKEKIDINDIPIAIITKDYLEYLDKKEKINLERESEFLFMASLLIHIKSQMLLPRENISKEEADPRQVLVNQLLDYQKIKAACSILRKKEEERLHEWQRTTFPVSYISEDTEFSEVSIFDLAETFFILISKKGKENIKIIKGKDISLKEKTREMLGYLQKNSYMDFLDYFNNQKTIREALISFFCLLELIKTKAVIVTQKSLFHPIKVWLKKENNRWGLT